LTIGKLYRLSDGQFITNINYRLLHNDGIGNWWGELTLVDNVSLNEEDRFIIELEDKRKSQCYLKKRVNRAVSGIPPRWTYHFSGNSPIV
jgi:hypothetical protein